MYMLTLKSYLSDIYAHIRLKSLILIMYVNFGDYIERCVPFLLTLNIALKGVFIFCQIQRP